MAGVFNCMSRSIMGKKTQNKTKEKKNPHTKTFFLPTAHSSCKTIYLTLQYQIETEVVFGYHYGNLKWVGGKESKD